MARRRKFSREFKIEAVRMVTEEGHSLAQVARDLDLRPDMIRRWRKKLEQEGGDAFPGAGRLKPADAELQRLRRDLKRVRQERDILKKALAIFSDRPR
jgi:transposase